MNKPNTLLFWGVFKEDRKNMSIELKKKPDNYDIHNETFLSEKFSNIDLNVLKENKRIFIPYSELPEDDEQRHSYLDELTAFIEQKTGKHYSYFLVSETEPYEVSGFYIQIASELKDKNGEYVNNNDYVYDENGSKWHVTYYYKNNQPCILIDNDTSGYMVITSLRQFTLNPDRFWADDEELKKCPIEENKSNNSDTFNIGVVIAGLIFSILAIVVVVLFITHFSGDIEELISSMSSESANTQTADKTDGILDIINDLKNICAKGLLICLAFIPINIAFKILKRMRR